MKSLTLDLWCFTKCEMLCKTEFFFVHFSFQIKNTKGFQNVQINLFLRFWNKMCTFFSGFETSHLRLSILVYSICYLVVYSIYYIYTLYFIY